LRNSETFCETDSGVATLTLPTGLGKTLTGLNAGLSIRDRTGGGRVVYALPFTSIIDQVVDEATDIFQTTETEGVLATDHHLADTHIESSVDAADGDADEAGVAYDVADQNDDVAGMLAESWRAGLTVTTFVQLFESLAGPRNTQSMKLPALEGSVVVLDEPQSLPLRWWTLVRRLVEVLTSQYDATVISMTATQPELFDDAVPLINEVDEYFEVAERVDYHLHDSTTRFLDEGTSANPVDYATAADAIVADGTDGTATLAICNTIDSARKLTDAVTDRLPTVDVASTYLDALDATETGHTGQARSPATKKTKVNDPTASEKRDADRDAAIEATVDTAMAADTVPFLHLSSRMRPKDRIALVRILKKLRDADVPVVAVTTQVVEAGVDVSFDAVYRDLAPVDSIVQAAGRCNRSFEQERGHVTVWWLDAPGEQTKTPAVAVYDTETALTRVTAAALDHVRAEDGRIQGWRVARDAVTEYYRRLHDDKDVGRNEYATYVDNADGDALNDLSLIDTPRAVDVIVCRTPRDHALVTELKTAYETYAFDRIDDLQDRTKPLRISVPIYDQDSDEADVLAELPPLVSRDGDATGVRVLEADSRQYENYFDDTTGFVVPDSTLESRFL
jgi:CRISPR-associated endonuclease/helicase Cas3/CRISPR-associated endonuclease Cas3-HD